jgi:molybdopterin-guanine dinucleotide biosynthesis protein A
MADVGAVVLAGGRSSRMGTSKAGLEWHGSTLLRRVVGLVGRGVDGPVVVVRSPGQQLPALPAAIDVVEDDAEGRGPLMGIAAGLGALEDRVEGAFVCATDLPFLHPAFVRRVSTALAGADVAIPVVGGYRQPLAAAYRTALAGRARALLAEDRDRAAFLLEDGAVHALDEASLLADARLHAADPELRSVVGVNDPDAYAEARERPAPEVLVQLFGALAGSGGSATRTVLAATLGAAARTVGLELDRHLLAAVDGDQVVRDVETPLAAGDVVTFLSADAGG